MIIQTKSWNKNSFGLFDFESRDIHKKTLRVNGTCKLFSDLSDCITGKLLRDESVKDTPEIVALNEPLPRPDTGNSIKET